MEYSIIGKMYETPPTFDDNGNITNKPTYQSGFHVNARGEVPTEWEQYEIEAPATPLRIYQGGGTRFFVFPDQSTFEASLPDESSLP